MVRLFSTTQRPNVHADIPFAGKNWHAPRAAFRPNKSLTSFKKQRASAQALAATKAKETEMRTEKKEARDQLVTAIREKRERKAERERWEKLEAKLGAKRAERKRRREKRNKMLHS